MGGKCTYSLFSRAVCAMLSLYFLNISIDTTNTFTIGEDLSYNKQESIVEIIVEKVFGFDGAIAEFDEQDAGQNFSAGKNLQIDNFILHSCIYGICYPAKALLRNSIYYYSKVTPCAYFDIHLPPPDFIA